MTAADSGLAWAGVTGQLEALRAGTTTSATLVDLVLSRVAVADPVLHVVVRLRAEAARAEATAADEARVRGEDLPLLGLPFLVKDAHAVAGLPTGSQGTGSPARPAAEDSPVVAALRRAGAIPVGTTTTPELMLWPHGPARNPWDPARTAGGSSSGSAAAVAAGLVAVATASDGGGSIRLPASYCGLVGLKAAPGQLPGGGGWHGLSVDGVLTRSVADTAVVLDALTAGTSLADALAAGAPGALSVGWSDHAPLPPHAGPDAAAAVRAAVAHLRMAGHRVEPVALPWRAAGLSFIPRYLRGGHDDRRRLADPAAVQRRTAVLTQLGVAVRPGALAAARRRGEALGRALRGLGHDLLVLPSAPTAAPPAAPRDEAGFWGTVLPAGRATAWTSPLNAAGVAAVSLPVHEAGGLPLGVQLVAPDGDLARLVAVAAQLQEATGWTARRPSAYQVPLGGGDPRAGPGVRR